jgi:hypothetical protein
VYTYPASFKIFPDSLIHVASHENDGCFAETFTARLAAMAAHKTMSDQVGTFQVAYSFL